MDETEATVEAHATTTTSTMVRTQVAVDEVGFLLAEGQDILELKRRIEFAAQAGGRFVDFVVVGNRAVSVLVSASSHIVISTETVEYDARDTGDDAVPFGGVFDML